MTKLVDKVKLTEIEQIVKDEFKNLLPVDNIIDTNYRNHLILYQAIVISILSNFMCVSSLLKIVPFMSWRTINRRIHNVIEHRSDKEFDVCYQKSLSRATAVIHHPIQQIMDF